MENRYTIRNMANMTQSNLWHQRTFLGIIRIIINDPFYDNENLCWQLFLISVTYKMYVKIISFILATLCSFLVNLGYIMTSILFNICGKMSNYLFFPFQHYLITRNQAPFYCTLMIFLLVFKQFIFYLNLLSRR